ncbi:MAG: transposase [Phycisphaerae bacterium]|nr:transposase [Phycisphaerae bacterium]
MTLAAAWLALWDETREVFRQQRVWERARRLGLSQLACLERHTVTGLLCSCGRQFVDWSADYRLFSEDKWELNALFRPVIRGALNLQPDPNRLVVAIDDTLLRKSSRKTPPRTNGPPIERRSNRRTSMPRLAESWESFAKSSIPCIRPQIATWYWWSMAVIPTRRSCVGCRPTPR